MTADTVGQALRLPITRATDAGALQFSRSSELAIVLGGVEMAFRFGDQAVIVDLPQFVAADANRISVSGVRAD